MLEYRDPCLEERAILSGNKAVNMQSSVSLSFRRFLSLGSGGAIPRGNERVYTRIFKNIDASVSNAIPPPRWLKLFDSFESKSFLASAFSNKLFE